MIRILFIVSLFLMSCSEGSFIGELITQSKSPTNQKIREFEEPKVTSYVIKALLNDPKTQRSVQSIYLARLETDSVETDGKTKLMHQDRLEFLMNMKQKHVNWHLEP